MVRQFYQEVATFNFKAKGSGESGLITTNRPGPEILSHTTCKCGPKGITARSETGFPANGRTINSGKLIKIPFDFLPRCIEYIFYFKSRKPEEVLPVIHLAEDQQFTRRELKRLSLVSFVADKTVLPKEDGISNRPMKGSVPFSSPQSLQAKLDLPHHGRLAGVGLRRSITLIIGSGYHGKSTLSRVLEAGVYNHVAGDGREYVTMDNTAMKLRIEDGRSIQNTNTSLFINDLPNKENTRCFSAEDASESMSQAAAVIEGIEAGSWTFLIDEDTSATNFMARGDLMQKIISRSKEPIMPFIERARDLYENTNISTIMVAGSFGAYFCITDIIIQMGCYEPLDITDETKAFCASYSAKPIARAPDLALPAGGRKLQTGTFTSGLSNSGLSASGRSGQSQNAQLEEYDKGGYRQGGSYGRGRDGRDGARGGYGSQDGREERIKVKVYGKDSLQVGGSPVDPRFMEQLIDPEQTNALAQMLRYCMGHQLLKHHTVADTVILLEKEIRKGGITAVNDTSCAACGLCMPRTQETFACINQYWG